MYSLGDTGCTYKYVAAKTNLKIYNRPLRSEKIAEASVGETKLIKVSSLHIIPARRIICLLRVRSVPCTQEGSVRVDEKQLDLREKLDEALKFGPVEVVAQFRIPKGRSRHGPESIILQECRKDVIRGRRRAPIN